MARSLWFVAGAGAGVYAVTRARRAVEAVTAIGAGTGGTLTTCDEAAAS